MKKMNKALSIILTLILLISFIPQGLAASNTATIAKATITGLSQTNAVLNATVTWTGSKPSQVGFYMGKSTSGMYRVGYDTVLPNSNIIKFWYNLNTECKVKLTPNTTYYCKPYIIQSGKHIWGSVVSFKTPAITASFSSIQSSNVSTTKAQISCYLTYSSSVKPSKVGMYLEYGTTRRIVGTDTVLPNTKTFKFWYDLSGLTAGTKYTYQPFAIINGVSFYGSKASFTTLSASASSYQWPIKASFNISSGYGPRTPIFVNGQWTPNFHNGIDLATNGKYVPVYPIQDGVVVIAKFDSIGGNYVVIKHSNNWHSYYGHLNSFSVKVGDTVSKATQIGITGKTGSATGVHLHLTVAKSSQWWVSGQYFDPSSILR